jgi:hypothetical protein
MVKPKPVLGPDDMLLLLTHHWARDTYIFPTEDQCIRFAVILLFSIYTGCRPAELVDRSRHKAGRQAEWDDPDDPDSENPDCEGQELKEVGDPDYDKPVPWESSDNSSYNESDDGLVDFNEFVRSYKALCYKDLQLWIVQNPKKGERDLLAMEVTLAHHKGADKKPKL